MEKKTTFKELEKQLQPCPLCGGRAHIGDMSWGLDGNETEVHCQGCGLSLRWVQKYRPPSLRPKPDELNFVSAWNRRANR